MVFGWIEENWIRSSTNLRKLFLSRFGNKWGVTHIKGKGSNVSRKGSAILSSRMDTLRMATIRRNAKDFSGNYLTSIEALQPPIKKRSYE